MLVLARHFAAKFARKLGRKLAPLSKECDERLTRYDWPGNVRELANVIERAVITARDGRLHLDRAIPQPADFGRLEPALARALRRGPDQDRGRARSLERENIRRALEASGGKISGPDGAAVRLGLKASTLSSRMKVLGITQAVVRTAGFSRLDVGGMEALIAAQSSGVRAAAA